MATNVSFEKVGECLYRNPSSETYFAIVKIKGKQYKASLETKTLPEARRKLKKYRDDIEKVDPKAGKITVEKLVDDYVKTIESQSASTVNKKRFIADKVKKQWGPLQAKTITKSQVLGWLAALKDSKTGEPLGVNSRNKCLRFVRAVFNLGVDDRVLLVSPIAGVKEEKGEQPLRETPTMEEFVAIVASIRNQLNSDTREESADFVEFIGLAGLGLAEARSLTWGNVDFNSGDITAYRFKTKKGFSVPIYPQVRPLLEKRLALAMARNGCAPLPTEKVFLVGDPKTAIESACLRLNLVRLKKDKSVPRYSSRSFRRMFITTAIERGVDVGIVSSWQGHSDGGRLILSTYRHLRSSHSKRMAELMSIPSSEAASVG